MDPLTEFGAPGQTDADLQVLAYRMATLRDVLTDPNLTDAERRSITAEWNLALDTFQQKASRGRVIVNDRYQGPLQPTPEQQLGERAYQAENQYFRAPEPVQAGLMRLPPWRFKGPTPRGSAQ